MILINIKIKNTYCRNFIDNFIEHFSKSDKILFVGIPLEAERKFIYYYRFFELYPLLRNKNGGIFHGK